MGRVVHFEFPSTDPEASVKFYENVFGWKIAKYDSEVDYWLVSTGEKSEPGIDGAIYRPGETVSGTVNTVEVDNLDETIARVLASGGRQVAPRMEIPNVGHFAYVLEPGGTIVGILEPVPGGMM